MDYYGLPEEIEELERSVAGLRGPARLEPLVRLAWYMRQRDTRRALALADEAQQYLDPQRASPAGSLPGRLLLIRAEVRDMQSDLPGTIALCDQAMARFQSDGDAVGIGDTCLLQARTWVDRGSGEQIDAMLAEAARVFEHAGDPVRHAHARIQMAERVFLRQDEAAIGPWLPALDAAAAIGHSGLDAYVEFMRGLIFDARSDLGNALAHTIRAYEAALRCGRMRAAINTSRNICDMYADVGAYDDAIEWGQRSVDLPRSKDWPVLLGGSLVRLAGAMRRMGRREVAIPLVQEGLTLLEAVPSSKLNAMGRRTLGELIIEDDPALALAHFEKAQQLALDAGDSTGVRAALRGKASAQSRLGRVDEAMACIDAVLAGPQAPRNRVDTLMAKADIMRRHGLSSIHLLEEALALAQAEDKFAVPENLLASLSSACEAAGDPARALQFERRAAQAREQSQSAKAVQLAVAMQVRWDTQRARAEAAHQQALAQAETARADAQAAANQAKSTFLANMSHELRSPLNAMLGFARLLSRDETLPAPARADLDVILHSGEHLYALINQVLEMSKIEAGRMSLVEVEFDLHALLDELREMFTPAVRPKQLLLVLQRDEGVPRHVRADAMKLRQVLINLLSNAVKFTNEGAVELRVRVQAPGARPLLGFEVIDSGVGIAADELARLGQAFQQARAGQQAAEGTGLGLAISRGFVQLMGGELVLSSTPGQGTRTHFAVPVQPLDSAAHDAPAAPHARVLGLAPGTPAPRILVTDDRADGRLLLVRTLAPLGFEVREAADGAEAVAVWQQWSPQLILMDMRMPVMDGREATRRIKAGAGPQNTPVVVALTASSFEEQREEILASGCDDFMRKPFQEDALLETIARHLRLQYVREQPAAAPAAAEPDPQRLVALPAPLVERLRTALDQLDVQAVDEVIESIRELDPEVADTLAPLARRFEYERIRALLGPASQGGSA